MAAVRDRDAEEIVGAAQRCQLARIQPLQIEDGGLCRIVMYVGLNSSEAGLVSFFFGLGGFRVLRCLVNAPAGVRMVVSLWRLRAPLAEFGWVLDVEEVGRGGSAEAVALGAVIESSTAVEDGVLFAG